MVLSFNQIINNINKNKYHLIYFLSGDEPFFIDQITSTLEQKVIPQNLKAFNLISIYAKDSSVREIINTAKRFPMMSDKMLVIVKEAQYLKNIDDLKFYIQKPQKTTILVINYKYKKLDHRKALYKLLAQDPNSALLETKKLYENQTLQWIQDYIKNKQISISPKAALMLIEYLGTSLSKIANEIDKLTISLKPGTTITPQIIEQNIGISKDFNVFELQNALGKKDFYKTMLITQHFINNPKNYPLPMIISSLYYFFTKILKLQFSKEKNPNKLAASINIHPYFLPQYQTAAKNFPAKKIPKIISLLRYYDMRSKGIDNASTSNEQLLKELIVKLFIV